MRPTIILRRAYDEHGLAQFCRRAAPGAGYEKQAEIDRGRSRHGESLSRTGIEPLRAARRPGPGAGADRPADAGAAEAAKRLRRRIDGDVEPVAEPAQR